MSVETVELDVRAAFRAALQAIPGIPTSYAWEAGRLYRPEQATPFIEEAVHPVTSIPRALGRGGNIQHLFMCIATLVFPVSDGPKDIETAAGLLRAALSPATGLIYGETKAMVYRTETRPILVQPDWLRKPVQVSVSVYTVN